MVFGPTLVGTALAFDTVATGQLIREATGTARTRFPKVRPGDLLKAALQINELSERGLEPSVSTGPLGNLVVGSRDQDVPLLATEAALRRVRTPTAAALSDFSREVAAIRQPPQTVAQAVIPPGQLGGVTARLQNGAVVRSTSPPSPPPIRRSGPCAGANSSIQRIRCNIGGLT